MIMKKHYVLSFVIALSFIAALMPVGRALADAEIGSTVSDFKLPDVRSGNVPEFLVKMGARMPAYLLNAPDSDAAIKAVDAEWTGALPATFLFDAQGRIAYKRLGRIKPAELRAAIKTVTSDK